MSALPRASSSVSRRQAWSKRSRVAALRSHRVLTGRRSYVFYSNYFRAILVEDEASPPFLCQGRGRLVAIDAAAHVATTLETRRAGSQGIIRSPRRMIRVPGIFVAGKGDESRERNGRLRADRAASVGPADAAAKATRGRSREHRHRGPDPRLEPLPRGRSVHGALRPRDLARRRHGAAPDRRAAPVARRGEAWKGNRCSRPRAPASRRNADLAWSSLKAGRAQRAPLDTHPGHGGWSTPGLADVPQTWQLVDVGLEDDLDPPVLPAAFLRRVVPDGHGVGVTRR